MTIRESETLDEDKRRSAGPILATGSNCWKKVEASRLAFLIDGDAYFHAVAEAFSHASRSIWILGWDTDSRLRLRREPDAPGLERFLRSCMASAPELQVHILSWDFAMVYAFERELTPLFRLSWSRHPRLHYHLDAHHPLGASHHQKVVVIDDRLAFAGGLDLTKNRWDNPEHRPEESRRTTPSGNRYQPFHDVQMAVAGEAAEALGELARYRWHRSTGKWIEPEPNGATDLDELWPPDLPVDATEARVGIARTFPEHDSTEGVREVERLYLDAIGAARDSIYIETQYLTSVTITEALGARLVEREGPEIVAVVPERCSGWLEETTMGGLRDRCLRKLLEADRWNRLRVYQPMNGDTPIFVHSKVMVVDDRLARVGSANLTARSMGLDSECDLALEAEDGETREAVRSLRSRLLGEHLGQPPDSIERARRECRSLVSAIERLRSPGNRRLSPVAPPPDEGWLPTSVNVADPERPIEPDLLVEDLLKEDSETNRRVAIWRGGLLLLGALVLTGLWQWGPLGDWLTVDHLSAWAISVRTARWSFPIVVVVYVLSGVVMVPLTLLTVVTAATFETGNAILYALSGTLASGMTTFGIGRMIGRDTLRALAGTKLNRISRKLARRGVLAVATVRLLPLAPYGIVNMVAGASHIRFRDFTLGTLLGTLPGILAITLLADQIVQTIRKPSVESVFVVLVVAVALVAVGNWVRRRLSGRGESD